MDPSISGNFDSFSEMVLNLEHQQDHFGDDFYNFYLEDANWVENEKDKMIEDDDDDDDFLDFESSQVHQLIHTQPIHLINYQMLHDYNTRENADFEDRASTRSSMSISFDDVEDTFDSALNVYDSGNVTNDVNTAATSATSAHFKHNLFDTAAENCGLRKYQSSISNFYENSNITNVHGAAMDVSGTVPMKNSQNAGWDIPRSLPLGYKDAGQYLDFSQCDNLQDDLEVHVPPLQLQESHHHHYNSNNDKDYHYKNYNYQITTDTSRIGRRPTEEENSFVKTLNSKLSRYTGYFGAGSKDQEYHDKVRFQEISYKFSKTYF